MWIWSWLKRDYPVIIIIWDAKNKRQCFSLAQYFNSWSDSTLDTLYIIRQSEEYHWHTQKVFVTISIRVCLCMNTYICELFHHPPKYVFVLIHPSSMLIPSFLVPIILSWYKCKEPEIQTNKFWNIYIYIYIYIPRMD